MSAYRQDPTGSARPADHVALWARVLLVLVAAVLALSGLALLWLGGNIAWLGGTWYYVLAGLLLVATAVALGLGRHRSGLALFGLTLAATLAWSLFEIAGKGFMPAWGVDLGGRAGVMAGLFGFALFVWLTGRPPRHPRDRTRPFTFAAAAVVLVAAGAVLLVLWERPVEPATAAADIPPVPPEAETEVGHNGADTWLAFGGSPLGQRFSPAAEITPANVARLREAWRMRSGDLPPNDRVFFSSQNTPLKIGDSLYLCTSSNKVFALDPATGAERWRFDPQVPVKAMESLFSVACRAVGYYALPQADPAAECPARVYVATVDSRMIALDAATGAICRSFGTDGTVDLAAGMGLRETGFASSTSGPAVIGDLILVGQQVSDNQRRDAPSGVVRAYDAAGGELLWAWDALRQGGAQEPLPEGEIYPRGTPNVWIVIGGDPELGLVYLGTGNSGNDHWGGTRTPEEDRFTAAVVAVDMATGETRWDFATVVHDLWDYDLGAQPVVADLPIDGVPRRVVIQGTKTGSLFVFDAETGEPLRPIEWRAAPQGPLPGDWVNEVQPHSVFYPNFAGKPGREPETLDARHTFGVTPIDAAVCRLQFHQMRYEGIFTPPTDEGLGTLLFPGTIGGMNWGGIAVDRRRNIVVTNHSRLPNRVQMYPREQVDDIPVGDGGARPDQEIAPQAGAPYGVDRPMWLSPLDVPCIAPPWGYVSGTDLETGELLWTRLLGTGYDSGPIGLPTFLRVPMGTGNIGGPLVTATGLTFIAAAQDDFLRAFETETGRLLWAGRLPAGGQASPMTYEHEGRQYVLIVATGHQRLQTRTGDYLVAFALGD